MASSVRRIAARLALDGLRPLAADAPNAAVTDFLGTLDLKDDI